MVLKISKSKQGSSAAVLDYHGGKSKRAKRESSNGIWVHNALQE